MSLKSSLADCAAIALNRSPKYPANASLTRSVTPSSLTVSGKRSYSSNLGSFGEFDAWHSAMTMRRIAASTVVRTDSS